MAQRLGKKIPDGPVGESWEVSAHPNGPCRVASGPFAGMALAELSAHAGPALVGEKAWAKYGGTFPLLVKLIDVSSLASVQVHPNDEQARRLEGYPWGKTEAWYIIERSPDARFHLGLVDGVTPESFRAALAAGTAHTLLASPEVAAGDCLFVPPGTLHACGNGVLMLEIQQSSDITYRAYDWDRVDENGKRRELHVEKVLQVIDFSARARVFRAERRPDSLNPIPASTHFSMYEARIEAGLSLAPGNTCATGTLIDGRCQLESRDAGFDLECGDSFVVPAETDARLEASDRATVIITFISRERSTRT